MGGHLVWKLHFSVLLFIHHRLSMYAMKREKKCDKRESADGDRSFCMALNHILTVCYILLHSFCYILLKVKQEFVMHWGVEWTHSHGLLSIYLTTGRLVNEMRQKRDLNKPDIKYLLFTPCSMGGGACCWTQRHFKCAIKACSLPLRCTEQSNLSDFFSDLPAMPLWMKL